MINVVRGPEHELHEPLQDNRIRTLPVVNVLFADGGCIVTNEIQAFKGRPIGGFENLEGVVVVSLTNLSSGRCADG